MNPQGCRVLAELARGALVMKHRSPLHLLFALVALLSSSPLAWSAVGPYGGWINDLKEDQSGRLLAATSFGGVYRSADDAESWQQIYGGTLNFDFISIATNSSGHIFIGSEGHPFGGVGFVRSTDDGVSWQILSNALNTKGARDLLVMPSGEIFACAFSFNGGVFRSTNNGAAFTAVSGLTTVSAWDIEANSSGHLFVATRFDSNRLFRSTDNGATWQLASTGLTSDVNDIFIDASNTLFAATDTGVFMSTNGGANWTNLNAPGPGVSYPSVVVGPGGAIYASLNSGSSGGGVCVSTNGGATWTQDSGLPPRAIGRVLRTSSGELFAGGYGQGIYRRGGTALRSQGAAWEWKNNGLANTWVTSIAEDPNTGTAYAGTQHAGIFKSTDTGLTWMSSSNGIPAYESIYDVTVNFDGTVIASGASDGIYVSTDSGDTWTNTFGVAATALGCNVQGHVFGGQGNRVYKSTNGGSSWTPTILPSVQFIGDIAVDGTKIYVATGTPFGFGSQGVWRSTDNGATWGALNSGLTNLDVTSIAVGPDAGPCRISCGTNGSGLFDLDESAASFVPGWLPSGLVPNDAVIAEVRKSIEAKVAELYACTISGGNCFDVRSRDEVLAEIQTLEILLGPTRAFGGVEEVVLLGTNGAGILRQAPGATDVAEARSFRNGLLSQNEPNPFISRTQIHFALENDGPVSLRVYDVRGREVETLVDESRSAGTYDVTWDAKARPSGVYFYRLTAGGFERTQKMVLLR